jgi:hypothetical protein
MTLTSSLSAAVTALQQAPGDLSTASDPLTIRRAVQLASGTGAGAADRMWHDTRSLAASGTEDIDVAGSLLDSFGGTVVFARIKGLYIAASASNTNNVVVGGAGSNAWATLLNAAGTVTLRPGAAVMVMAGAADATGYAVTAGTGDLLHVANSGSGSAISYDVVIIGASA